MSERPATKSGNKRLHAARSRVSFKYNFSYDKHWVFEDYKSGEYAIHGPFDSRDEANAEIVDLINSRGSMGYDVKVIDLDEGDEYGRIRRALNGALTTESVG